MSLLEVVKHLDELLLSAAMIQLKAKFFGAMVLVLPIVLRQPVEFMVD